MLERNTFTKLRHFIKEIPGAGTMWFNTRLALCPSYREDGLCTIHSADFIQDPDFQRAYGAALEMEPGMKMHWRSHVAQWLGHQASFLEGDYVECGVNRAFLSTSIMTAINFREMKNRSFYLFDTYSGLVPELVTDDDKAASYNRYEDCYDFVKNAFKDYPNVHVIKGVVPESLMTVHIEKVAYLSIDMNCVVPEIEAIKYFWPKMVRGGFILIDDYGWRGHEAQKDAADEFAKSVGTKVLSMPTGQGLLMKH